MNILLIGFRGAGKSSVAAELSKKLDKVVISTDDLIEISTKMPITKFVKKFGWEKFRYLESALINDISNMDEKIIDLGGGFVDVEENLKNIKDNNILIWLDADITIIKQRIKNDKERPSVTGKSVIEEIDQLYNKRKNKYQKIADLRIDTSKLDVTKTTNLIIGFLNE